jgi:hypothetical protein
MHHGFFLCAIFDPQHAHAVILKFGCVVMGIDAEGSVCVGGYSRSGGVSRAIQVS